MHKQLSAAFAYVGRNYSN